MERKYKIQQVSGNTPNEGRVFRSGDIGASLFLDGIGFEARQPAPLHCAYIGATPKSGKEFHIYYQEPKDDKERFGGTFRLARMDGEREEIIDQGQATKSHIHGGLGTLTFYGKGEKLASWSFHCKQEEIP